MLSAYLTPTETHILPVHPGTSRSPKMLQVVDRYHFPPAASVAKSKVQKVVMTFAHANGLHKELWHPTIRRLVQIWRTKDYVELDLYAMDCAIQGDSAVLNEAVLNDDYMWGYWAMDILHFIDLLKLKSDNAIFVGIGHSMGGAATVLAEIYRPKVFDVIIAIEPVLLFKTAVTGPMFTGIKFDRVEASRKRRDVWPSREEAKAGFLKKPFYQVWDPEVLDLHVQYGLRDKPGSKTGEVTLKCPKEQEAIAFQFNTDAVAAFDGLPTIQCPLLFLFGTQSNFLFEDAIIKYSRPQKGYMNFIEAGHLIVQERPNIIAREIESFVHRHLLASLPGANLPVSMPKL